MLFDNNTKSVNDFKLMKDSGNFYIFVLQRYNFCRQVSLPKDSGNSYSLFYDKNTSVKDYNSKLSGSLVIWLFDSIKSFNEDKFPNDAGS